MKKKDMIRIFENAIEEKVSYIAIKQTNNLLKSPVITIIPNINFRDFADSLVGYNDNLELELCETKTKLMSACVLKEMPKELKIYINI